MVKCEYDRERQAALCAKLISMGCGAVQRVEEHLLEIVAESAKSKLDAQTMGLYLGFVEPLMRIAPAVKNPSFEEEQEWRLVRGSLDTPDSEVRFRASKYTIVPYCEFKLADDDRRLEVEEIIVGPNPDPKQARQSVEFLLRVTGVQCQRVVEYSGTYRNW